jgi:hypothetical protein
MMVRAVEPDNNCSARVKDLLNIIGTILTHLPTTDEAVGQRESGDLGFLASDRGFSNSALGVHQFGCKNGEGSVLSAHSQSPTPQ